MSGRPEKFRPEDFAMERDHAFHRMIEHAVGDRGEPVAVGDYRGSFLERREDGSFDVVLAIENEQALERERFRHGRFAGEDRSDIATDRTIGRLFRKHSPASARADAFGNGPCRSGFSAAVDTFKGNEETLRWSH